MISLILKDILLQFKSMVICSIFIILTFASTDFLLFVYVNNDSFYPIIFFIFINFSLFTSLFEQLSNEIKNNSLVVLTSCPLDKKLIVLSKYFSTICTFFFYVAIVFISHIIRGILGSNIEFTHKLVFNKLILVNLLICIIICSFIYPLYFTGNTLFKLFYRLVSYMIIIFVLNLAYDTSSWNSFENFFINLTKINFLIYIPITILAFIFSYLLSLNALKNRQFY